MDDELFIVRRVTRHDGEANLDWTDALWLPLDKWPTSVARDEAAEEKEIAARFAEWQAALHPAPPDPNAPAPAPAPEPTAADKLAEARDLLSRLDEMRIQAAAAVDQLAAAAAPAAAVADGGA